MGRETDETNLTPSTPPRVHVGVAVLLQQLLLIYAEDVHPIGVESEKEIVREVGQKIRHALHL